MKRRCGELGSGDKAVHGDWQTPQDLADAALAAAMACARDFRPAGVVDPTCGTGAFLSSAGRRFTGATLLGFELNATYAARASAIIPRARSRIVVADFFTVDWEAELARLPSPALVLGNPPWVTNSSQGKLSSTNLPPKKNVAGLPGLSALTGESNFDICEWMILRLLCALEGKPGVLAMICKSAVARRVLARGGRGEIGIAPGALFTVDARSHFDAAVDAVLLVGVTGRAPSPRASWPIYSGLTAPTPQSFLAVVDGQLSTNLDGFERTRQLTGASDPEWRSGIKHDAARVLELTRQNGAWINGAGDVVDVEEEHVFPLMKGSDLGRGRPATRGLLVVQRKLGEDTAQLRRSAPRTWAYLRRHEAAFEARKSRIYAGAPPFSLFGVGPYTFLPWKVAVSGLHKRCAFRVVGPHAGRPVVFDDTCYFLPFVDGASARRAARALASPEAQEFLSSRIFWDDKRPIKKRILQTLDLRRLAIAGRHAQK